MDIQEKLLLFGGREGGGQLMCENIYVRSLRLLYYDKYIEQSALTALFSYLENSIKFMTFINYILQLIRTLDFFKFLKSKLL